MSTSWLSGDTAVIEERASAPALITGKGQLWFNTSTHYLHYVDSTGADYLVATDIIDAAPADATYIVKTSNGTLTNEFALSSLGTGLLKVTTGTGDLTSITTSAGISALLSDETGSGALVFNDTPTILTPTIASFVNANHTHLNAAGGGTLDTAAIATGQLALARGGTNADLSATGGTGQFLRQSSTGAAVTVAVIASADIATALTTPGPIGGTTPNTGKFTSVAISGTSGAGYVELVNQASAPSTPSSAGRLFFDNSNRFSWIGTNTYTRTFDGTANSANRIYVLPDQAGTILLATYTGAVASTGTHTITGSADAVQFAILANSTNTSDLVQFQTSGGTVQTRFSADGRVALYGTAFTDTTTIIEGTVAISIVGSATQRTLYRLGPTVTITTANETSSVTSVNGSLTLNQNGFNVTTSNATTYQLTVTGSTGTLTNGRAMNMAITNSGGGTITTATTLFISAPTNSGGGTITSYAGLSINTSTVATQQTLLLLGTNTIASGTNYTIDANSSTYASRLGAALTITGSADTTQLAVKGNGTQTTVTFDVQNSSGTSQFSVSNAGVITTPGRFVGPVWAPAADSTSALKITKADGTTAIITVDTTNSVIGIGTTPNTQNVVTIAPTYTDLAAVGRGMNVTSTHNLTANNSIGLRGISFTASVNQGAFNLTGANGAIANNSVVNVTGASGVVTAVQAITANFAVTNGGTLTSGYHIQAGSATAVASTLTSLAVFCALANSAATNNTYVLLGTSTIPSGNWGIYSATTNNNLIQGPLSLKNSTTTPTAYLHLGAGTTAASTAPLKFTTGTSMTSAEAGAMEYTTDDLFFTISTSTARKRLLMADPVGGLTSNRVPYVTTNGRLTDSANFTFDGTTVTVVTLAKPTTFNGDTLAGNALATNVGRIHLTGQTAAISITSIFTPPSDGEYVISLVLTDTTAGVSGTISATITWTDYNGVQTFATSALTVATTGEVDFTKTIHARTTGAIRYQVDLSSIIGSPQFAIDINVIRLS